MRNGSPMRSTVGGAAVDGVIEAFGSIVSIKGQADQSCCPTTCSIAERGTGNRVRFVTSAIGLAARRRSSIDQGVQVRTIQTRPQTEKSMTAVQSVLIGSRAGTPVSVPFCMTASPPMLGEELLGPDAAVDHGRWEKTDAAPTSAPSAA